MAKLLPPSQRLPRRFVKPPEGCVDVWTILKSSGQVSRHNVPQFFEAYLDLEVAKTRADNVWHFRKPGEDFRIIHRGGYFAGDKLYLVSLVPTPVTRSVGSPLSDEDATYA